MSRSLKKGPYINVSLEKKILAMNESGKKNVVKTWARASMISPDFVGHTVAVLTVINLSLFMLQRIWLATSLESSLQHVALAVTLVTESKLRVKPFKNLSK